MKDVNKVILMGRLGADPILRETKNGTPVVHFPLATSRRFHMESAKTDGETGGDSPSTAEERTQWHKVVVWGKQGTDCALYLKKGQAVYVEGTIRSHKYDGKDGSARMAFEVHAESVNFLGKSLGGKERNEETREEAIAVNA